MLLLALQNDEYVIFNETERTTILQIVRHYRCAATIPFLDHVIHQIDERFNATTEPVVEGFVLIPTELITRIENDGDGPATWKDSVTKLVDRYQGDFPYRFKLPAEMEIYETYWLTENERLLTLRTNTRLTTETEDDKVLQLPNSIAATLQAIKPIKDVVPTLVKLLRLLGTIPVTACECERCNSALKRLKDYTRSTMGQERMDSLASMHIHRDIDVNVNTIIDEFAKQHPRRMQFSRILEDDN